MLISLTRGVGGWIHCVCACEGDVYSATINMDGLTPCWMSCDGWHPFRKERDAGWLYGLEWGTVGWGAVAFGWIPVSACSAMLCSLLSPVIAVMLSFVRNFAKHLDICNFQQFHTTSIISWRKYSLCDIPILLHQSSLPCFCQPFRPIHALYIIGPRLPHKSRLIWRCSWILLVPKCSLKWVVQAVSIIATYCTTLPEHTFPYSHATRMLRL